MNSEASRSIGIKLAELFPALNERQLRMLAAAEARQPGRGGVTAVARYAGMLKRTIYRGLDELAAELPVDRIRNEGARQKKN